MRSPVTIGWIVVLVAASTTIGSSTTAPASTATDRVSRTLPLPRERSLAVAITVGDMRIVGEVREDALVEVVRHAPDAASLARIPVAIDEQPARIEIRVLQPGGATDARLRSDVTLRVPERARLEVVRVFEGRLELSGISGHVTAEVQRGPIEARSISGAVRLETAIGDVVVRDARLVPGGVLRLRTFNGDVRLGLAERPADARILALALNGTIRSDIPLTIKDTWGPRWGEATLGRGEPVISIDVVTGDVEITSK